MAPYRKLEQTLENKRAYANKWLAREPIMEIFQHKGGSECVNGLSSVLGGGCVDATDFQRSALLVGLKEEQAVGVNPIKLGVIASTDSHTATPGGVAEESWGGAVVGEATALDRLRPGVLTSGIDGNPGGLAGVWANENTRDAVFDAMLRREVFGTSGPRIVPRLFAGWEFPADVCGHSDRASLGYELGVPMGGDLPAAPEGSKPQLLVYAAKDPNGNDLQALQVIKGWIDDDGAMNAEVIPVVETDQGAAMLCALFTDDAFDPSQSAYYYLRVVEPERPRWHTYDCARIPEENRPAVCSDGSHPETIREMA